MMPSDRRCACWRPRASVRVEVDVDDAGRGSDGRATIGRELLEVEGVVDDVLGQVDRPGCRPAFAFDVTSRISVQRFEEWMTGRDGGLVGLEVEES